MGVKQKRVLLKGEGAPRGSSELEPHQALPEEMPSGWEEHLAEVLGQMSYPQGRDNAKIPLSSCKQSALGNPGANGSMYFLPVQKRIQP